MASRVEFRCKNCDSRCTFGEYHGLWTVQCVETPDCRTFISTLVPVAIKNPTWEKLVMDSDFKILVFPNLNTPQIDYFYELPSPVKSVDVTLRIN